MYLLQAWFSPSDEGVEDAIYDSYAMRRFMRLDFRGRAGARRDLSLGAHVRKYPTWAAAPFYGLIVSGGAATGKTTAIKQLGTPHGYDLTAAIICLAGVAVIRYGPTGNINTEMDAGEATGISSLDDDDSDGFDEPGGACARGRVVPFVG
jgi:hypothetical protein